jgi:hypothetical protein
MMQRLKAGTFAEELHKLASRYNEGTVCSLKEGQYKIEVKHQRALPLALRTTLQGIVGCTKERFSSPLPVHPGTAEYWTVHTQDQIFGARCDAYKAQWTGCSIACPDYQAEHAVRAVTWAIQSAIHTNVPTLTILVLPTYNKDTSSTAHMRWIKKYPEQCKILATLPRSLTKLQIPPNTRQPPAYTLKWNMQLVAVGNHAGFCKYLPYCNTSEEGPTWRHTFRDALQAALEQDMHPTSTQQQTRVQL